MDQLEYYRFMGFSAEVLRQRYELYADMFGADVDVVDVGCGRGEFLELLKAGGARGIGVDEDARMVEFCQKAGLDAVLADGTGYLEANPERFDGVFASHVVEHMGPAAVERLVTAAAGALRPGGRLLLVTPDPRNLAMHLGPFWRDLQHVRFYSDEIMHWLLHRAGVRDIVIGGNPAMVFGPERPLPDRPLPEPLPPPRRLGRERLGRLLPASIGFRLRGLEDRVNELTEWARSLYPPGEYYITGVKPSDRSAGG